jgi:hypothetical protein
MKESMWCLIFTIVFLGMTGFALAQNKGEPSSELCNAIEQFVAEIDATRAIKDKARRDANYTEAQKELAMVLKTYGKPLLLDAASSYAHYTELVLNADPRDPAFSDLVDKRLKSRTDLMNPCAPFTTRR